MSDETGDNPNTVEELEGADEGDLEGQVDPGGVQIAKNDRSISEFHRWKKEARLILDPEWQRNYLWDNKRASKLIESLLMEIPVPVVYFAKTDEGKYEVIDGVQRLSSVFRFIDGEFALSGLEHLRDFNGLKFGGLPPEKQSMLQDATLRTFELSPRTSKNLLFTIFERLNTGGVALNDMEVRNCVFRGPLNNLIKELANNQDFVVTASQNNLAKRMADRALVMRFLAFFEKGYIKAQQGLKRFLNDFCETYRSASDTKLAELRKAFERSMKNAVTVFGEKAYRIRKVDEHGNGQWAPRLNAAVFQVLSVSMANVDRATATQRADAIYEEYLDLVSTDAQWIDGVTKSTADANKIRYVFEEWNSRLEKVTKDAISTDRTRIFSRQLKEEMFQQTRTCSICGQEIKTIADAALDHEMHYWRGGKTIPTNARLAHRLCNLKRSKNA